MRDTQNTSITHRDLAPDRCEKRSRGIWQRVDTATRYRACRCGTLRAEWQCNSRQPVRSRSSGSALHTATRYRACRCGTLRAEWQCNSRQPVRSRSSGSALHTATRYRACRCSTLRVEWQCNWYAQGRVAVRLTATGTLRAEWQCRPRRPQTRKCHVSIRMRPK